MQTKTEVLARLPAGNHKGVIHDTIKGREESNSLNTSWWLRRLVMDGIVAKIYRSEFSAFYNAHIRAKRHITAMREMGMDVDQYHEYLCRNREQVFSSSDEKLNKGRRTGKYVLASYRQPEVQEGILRTERISTRKIVEYGEDREICLIVAIPEDGTEPEIMTIQTHDLLHEMGVVTIDQGNFRRMQCDWIAKYRDPSNPMKLLTLEDPNDLTKIKVVKITAEQYRLMMRLARKKTINPSETTILQFFALEMHKMPIEVPLFFTKGGKPDWERTSAEMRVHAEYVSNTGSTA